MRKSFAGLLMLSFWLPVLAQTSIPTPTTTLTSSGTTLQLPGSVKLTATVAPPAATAGMPTGSVTFLNGKTSLGTGPLAFLPGTESFPAPAITGTFGYYPFGIFALNSGTSKYSTLGVLDWYFTSDEAYIPELTVYSGQGANLFQASSATAYQITNSNIIGTYPGIDAYAVADFNKDGTTDVLLHGYNGNGNQYYLLPGTAAGGFDQTASVISPDNSGIGCDCSNPTEVVRVDDFNGDGYPDVAYAATSYGSTNPIGVALNAGATAPGSFQSFHAAPTVSDGTAGDTFQPTAISSGHFTASGHADLVVGGYFFAVTGAIPSYDVALLPGNGDGTFGTPAIFAAQNLPTEVATADFRQNGMTDVVVGNGATSSGGARTAVTPAFSTTNSIQVLWGDGNGNLTTSSTVTLNVYPSCVRVADFNNDGFPDILVVGSDGSLNVLLNDGTGKFSTVTPIGTTTGITSQPTIGDFNGDGMQDVAEITDYPISDSTTLSTASEVLNSASAQATLTTAPQTLPAGTDTLTASFPGDNNFAASTSTGLAITVTQSPTTLTWAPPAAMEYGVPLSATQLDATASLPGSITYSSPAGTVLPPGGTRVTATFAPTDSFDYAPGTATQTITVTAPSMTGISPSAAELGSASTTITVAGQGLVTGATVYWNKTALATTWVSLNELTAVIPATLLTTPGTATITVADPNGVAVGGSAPFSLAGATLTGISPSTAELGSPNTTIEVAGQGLVNGATVYWNKTALATTWVSVNQVTAVIPAALLTTPGTATITVADPNGVAVGGSATFSLPAPTLASIAPSSAKLGDGNTTVTITGQGFVTGATAYWNKTLLATTWVDQNHVTAVVPASLLATAGTATITVADPNGVAVGGSATFTILAGSATASASASATAEAGQNASVTLTVSPYPAAITATLTLSFTPNPPNTVTDPAVLFPNNTTTDVIQIPANSTAAIPAINFSSGSTAGTITITIVLTSGGANITPATLVPVAVTVPASPPVINSVTLTRSGSSMTVAILGLSSTRDMTQAHFHFTPASGQSLKTTDVTVDLTTPFGTWYGSDNSSQYGTTFLYTQPFTLDSDASTVGSVTVTLTNSQGDSQPGTAQ